MDNRKDVCFDSPPVIDIVTTLAAWNIKGKAMVPRLVVSVQVELA